MTNNIADYIGSEQNNGRYISSTIENEDQYTVPMPTAPVTISTTTENYFDTMVFNVEVIEYMKCKPMNKKNTKRYTL